MTAKTAAQLVQEAKGNIENFTPDQVQAEMANQRDHRRYPGRAGMGQWQHSWRSACIARHARVLRRPFQSLPQS